MDSNQFFNVQDENERDITYQVKESNNSKLNFQNFYHIHRDQEILKEFEYIAKHPIDGIYIVPCSKSLQVWYGVLFVRTGLFAEGMFHFKVILNDDYPYSVPSIRFVSNVFHPQISANGVLRMKYKNPESKRCKHQIWEALRYTRQCFYDIDLFSANNDEDFNKNIDELKARTRSCVLESLLEFEERERNTLQTEFESDNPFHCNLLSTRINSSLKRTMLLKSHDTVGQPEETLVSWTKHTVGKMWSNISQYSANGLHTGQSNGHSYI